jgi:hypothetical protein
MICRIATQAQDIWKLPSVVLQLPERGANSSALPTNSSIALPSSGSAADEWASYSLIGANTGEWPQLCHETGDYVELWLIILHSALQRVG